MLFLFIVQINKVMLYKDSFKNNDFNKFAKLEQLNSMLKGRDKAHENSRQTLQFDNSKANNTDVVSNWINQNSCFPNISNKIAKQRFESEGKNIFKQIAFIEQIKKLAFITVDSDILGNSNANTTAEQLKKIQINKSSEIYKDVIRWKKNINIYFK